MSLGVRPYATRSRQGDQGCSGEQALTIAMRRPDRCLPARKHVPEKQKRIDPRPVPAGDRIVNQGAVNMKDPVGDPLHHQGLAQLAHCVNPYRYG